MAACLALFGCAGTDDAERNPNPGITLESEPPGASVFVDGSFVGTTPAQVDFPDVDTVELRVELPGYATHTETVRRLQGWETVYYFYLDPQ